MKCKTGWLSDFLFQIALLYLGGCLNLFVLFLFSRRTTNSTFVSCTHSICLLSIYSLPQFCLQPGSPHSLFDHINFLHKDAMRSESLLWGRPLATTRLHWLWVWNGARKYWEMFYWNGNGNGNGKCSMNGPFPHLDLLIAHPLHRRRHYSKWAVRK